MSRSTSAIEVEPGVEGSSYAISGEAEHSFRHRDPGLHVAHFIQRYPPALGGSEAYFERLGKYHVSCGDAVTVWTSSALELEEMWKRNNPSPTPPRGGEGLSPPSLIGKGAGGLGLSRVRRFIPVSFPARRYILKALSLIPHRPLQCLTMPCNPICPGMWRDAGNYAGSLDAVHATAFPYAFPLMCGLRLARRRGVPFYLTPFLHLGDDRTRRQYTAPHLRWLLKQADAVFVQTRLERDAVIDLGVPRERVVLQGLGVEPAECTDGNRDAARRGWGIIPGEVVIGHLANNSPEKGTVDLLKAAERAWAAGHRFRVVLAGPEMPAFRTFWDRYTVKERVMRLGVLSDSERRDFYAGIDVFALPSRSDSFGLVLLEAWANGKPNVVYRAGGPGELVRHGLDGLHAECGDVAGLAEQLGRLASDQVLRHTLGDNGLARIGREFRWEGKLELVRDTIRQSVSANG